MDSKYVPPVMIHPKSEVEPGVVLGKNVKVWRWTHIMENAKIGDNTMIGANVFIASNVVIGSDCRIQNNVFIPDGIVIGSGVFIGPGCTFCNVKKPKAGKRGRFENTTVMDGAVLGANVTILPGLEIGVSAVVGAGAVVTKSIPDGKMAWGNPAKIQEFAYYHKKDTPNE